MKSGQTNRVAGLHILLAVGIAILLSLGVTWGGYRIALKSISTRADAPPSTPRNLEEYGGAFSAVSAIFGGIASLLIVATMFLQWRESIERAGQLERELERLQAGLDAQQSIAKALTLNAMLGAHQRRQERIQRRIDSARKQMAEYRAQWMLTNRAAHHDPGPVDDIESQMRKEIELVEASRKRQARRAIELESQLEGVTASLAGIAVFQEGRAS